MLDRIQEELDSQAVGMEAAEAAFALIKKAARKHGGIEKLGVAPRKQLERFERSLAWTESSTGRRMTVAEAYAFVKRLAMGAGPWVDDAAGVTPAAVLVNRVGMDESRARG